MEMTKTVYGIELVDEPILYTDTLDGLKELECQMVSGAAIGVYELKTMGKVNFGPTLMFADPPKTKAVKRGRPKGSKNVMKPAPEPEAA